MNIIHSSSLAYNPVAYTKPQTIGVDDLNNATKQSGKQASDAQSNSQSAIPSSTEEIKTALVKSGLQLSTAYPVPNVTQNQKAVNTYTHYLNQASKNQLAQTLTGIDVYV